MKKFTLISSIILVLAIMSGFGKPIELPDGNIHRTYEFREGLSAISVESIVPFIDNKKLSKTFRISAFPAGDSGLSNLFVFADDIKNNTELGIILVEDKDKFIVYEDTAKARNILKIKELQKKFEEPLHYNFEPFNLEVDGLTFSDSFIASDKFVNDKLEITVSYNEEYEDIIIIKNSPTKVDNSVDYNWYYSQHNSGQFSDINCGFAAIAMVEKWRNKEYDKSIRELRAESGLTDNAPISLIKDAIQGQYFDATESNIRKELLKGNIVVVVVKSSDFYNTESSMNHVIIIYGYDKEEFLIKDSWKYWQKVPVEKVISASIEYQNYGITVGRLISNSLDIK